VVHFVEETLQVNVHDVPVSPVDVRQYLPDCLSRVLPRPEPITVWGKFRVEPGAQLLVDRLPDHPVEGRGYAKHPFSPAAFGYQYPKHCTGMMVSNFFLQRMGYPKPPCDLLTVRVVTPARKGPLPSVRGRLLTLWRIKTHPPFGYIRKICIFGLFIELAAGVQQY